MEFLVNIRIERPLLEDGPARELAEREAAVAQELVAAGHIQRMWRVPGRRDNWGLWCAESATELHDLLSSLPMWPWMDVVVHPLAAHRRDPGPGRLPD
jgi:muconolactone D-isomerase